MKSGQDFLSGGGEMGALMRAHDWSANPLGPPSGWPELLKSTLRIVLSSHHPMLIWWGPDLIQFYNTAYGQTLGPERHPSALGQPGRVCWHEIWHLIGPEIDAVIADGTSTWHEESLVPVTRHGRNEDSWWTYGYSPLRDEQAIHGVLVVCNDVTKQHLAQRQQRFFIELADRLRPLSSATTIVAVASEWVGRQMAVSRVLFAEVDDGGKNFLIGQDWTRDGVSAVAGKTRTLDDFGPEVIDALRRGQAIAVDDVLSDARTAALAHAYTAIDIRSHLAIPLLKSGRLVAILGLHQNTPRHWTPHDIQTAEGMADRT